MASAPLELAWLHHEFCKLLVDIHRLDLARFYAKKGHEIAREAKCDQWILNIDHLMLRIEICQNNRNEARDVAIQTLAHARKLNIDCLVKINIRTIFANLLLVTTRRHFAVEFIPRSIRAHYLKLARGARERERV